jgi:hypothetical protein
MTLCAYNSSLISLIANRILDTDHHAVESDKQITQTAMQTLEDTATKMGSEDLRNIRDALKLLNLYADLISSRTSSPEQMSTIPSFWNGKTPENLLESSEFQGLDNGLFMSAMDLFWASISNDRN